MYKSILTSLCLLSLTACNNNDSEKKNSDMGSKSIKISSSDDITSLDPRKVRDLNSITTLRLLFEGLTRHNKNGELIPAAAENISISDDQKTYTFTLRNSFWSNGDQVTANDFVYAWKSMLDPKSAAPYAYQFYMIKGAKLAKEGKLPLEEVAIKALDDKTLVVELEHPTSYFLETTSLHAFFPVNKKWDAIPETEKELPAKFIGNGPYQLNKWAHHNVLIFKKNPKYWNTAALKRDEIQIIVLDGLAAFQLFETGELNWSGSPMGDIPPDAVPTLKKSGQLNVVQGAGTHWFRVNVEKEPFQNVKMRRAFNYAIDRKALVEHVLQGGQKEAFSVVPPSFGLDQNAINQSSRIAEAKTLFQEALSEMGITKEQLPVIKLSYNTSERAHKIAQAVQQQWNQVFGINVQLESMESKVLFEKITNHNYQLAGGSWFADIRDPSNFLEVLKYKSNLTNNTQWENKDYVDLLDQSSLEMDQEKRKVILAQAEAKLLEESPVIPLYFSAFQYLSDGTGDDVYLSDLGYLDFATE